MADEPIRVLRVIARLNVGGPALHVSYLTEGLDEIGYETKLVAGRVSPGEGSMEWSARERGIEPVYIPSLQREISPVVDAVAVAKVVRLIREFRPHVLHTHTAKAGAVGRTAALLAGSARPQAVVHTFHGHVLRGYFGSAKTAAFRRLEQGLARSTDALIAVSPEVRDDLVRLGIAPAAKIEVIRLGLDLDARTAAPDGAREMVRGELGIPADAFVIGWLGRMTEIKRVDDLLRAFAAAPDDAHLLLVGDGPLRPQLEGLAHELGLGARAHFAGFRNDVGSIYAASDVVALTSANEGTPVTVIEALAAGRPVVSTDVGGVSDVVADGTTGFLVPPGDVDAVADRLARIAESPEVRARMSESARASVVDRYSVPRLVRDVDELYRRLLAQPATKRLPAALSAASVEPAPRKLRVLIVSQYFPPEVGATQSRMQAFAEYLARRGHDVTVIAEFPNHPVGVVPPEYRGRLVEVDRSNPYKVVRVWVRASTEKTQRTRLSFYTSFMAMAALMSPLAGRADVVVATTPPLFTGLAGLAVARAMRAPFVLDVRDLWPAAATSLNQISGGVPTRVAELIERRLYRSASAVVAVTQPFCEHVDAIRGRPPATRLIPNGTLDRFFEETHRDRLGVPEDRYLVTFAGTLGIAQALPSAIDAAARVNGDADFAFVGEGPVKQIVEVKARGLTNVHFHPQIALEEVTPVLAGSDALLVTLSAHPTFRQFVPSKLIDFMAVGRPVILAAAGESAALVEQSRAGVVVPPEDPDALAEAVRWLRAHPDEAAEMGRRGRAFARGRLRSAQAAELEELLLGLAR
ncbi:MAG TPA: glycosyltransferase [Gaiellaceae bacterium]|nr:glycosyltransferase [Gaiellaceae bacterium]